MTIQKDLRPLFVGARDQGPRPTCLAFALSDAHAAARQLSQELSVDFLYYHALRRMPLGHGYNGVGLRQASDALQGDGQPLEVDWPYAHSRPSDITTWMAPNGLAVMHATGSQEATDINSISLMLDQDQPSVIIFQPSERFYYADASGLLPPHSPDSDLPSLHAVIAVGYGAIAGTRHILVRNSWGVGWGQRGHVWLAEDYLAPRLLSVTSIQAN